MPAYFPQGLSFFSALYEYRALILFPVLIVGICLLGGTLYRRKKIYFLYAVLLPLLLGLSDIGLTWCGWHYRMELRDRYAVVSLSKAAYTKEALKTININVMPPEIRQEYAKHDYHPRFRDLKAKGIGMIVTIPLSFAFFACLWLFFGRFFKRKTESSSAATPHEFSDNSKSC